MKLYWKVNHTIGINNTYVVSHSVYIVKIVSLRQGGTVSFAPQSGVK